MIEFPNREEKTWLSYLTFGISSLSMGMARLAMVGSSQNTSVGQKIEEQEQESEPSCSATVNWRTYVLVACVAGATLGMELIQTRILSFLYYNHVVYLTVTIALLGFGISGAFVSLFSSRSRDPQRAISLLAAGFVLSSFACLSLVSRIPHHFHSSSVIAKLVLSYVALVIPFLFSGAVLGWTFMINAKSISRLYFADLACSSGAVVAFVLLLRPIGGDLFVWLCSGLALVGFLAYSHKLLPATLRLGVVVAFAVCLLSLNSHLLGRQPESYKTLGRAFDWKHTSKIEATAWTPISRIDLWSDSYHDQVLGVPSADPGDTRMITQDADAFTMLWGPHKANEALEVAKNGGVLNALSLTYRFRRDPEQALVIGVGGGIDMVTAKAYGAQHVTGVEINPATVRLVSDPYRNFVLWPNWAGVELVRAEGRNFIRSKKNYYDTVVMSGVDTFSALNSGAYVLSENYLYTVEAMQDYLAALKSDGVMSIYRWFFHLGPRESLRLASIYLHAAEASGVPHPERCIMVVSEDLGWTYRWAATFVKKTPFTPAEVRDVLSAIARKPALSAVYIPKVFSPEEQNRIESEASAADSSLKFARENYNRLLTSKPGPERDAFIRGYMFRIDPVHDDRPFFFEYFKDKNSLTNLGMFMLGLRNIRGPASSYVLYVTLIVCIVLCVACILVPLWIFQRRGLRVSGAVPLLMFFACLGFGYMTFEIGAMQVLNVYVGDPAYSLSLVLGGLLVATGLGSALSERFHGRPVLMILTVAMLMIAAAMVLWLGATHVVQSMTMDQPFAIRILIVLLGLLPIGMLLGFPFPTALRQVEKLYPSFVAWAWGVNGVASVLASVAAIIVAMRIGFSAVVILGAMTYVAGLLSYVWHTRAAS